MRPLFVKWTCAIISTLGMLGGFYSFVHRHNNDFDQSAGMLRWNRKKLIPDAFGKCIFATREELEANIQVWLHQIYEQMLEQEQISIGWDTV